MPLLVVSSLQNNELSLVGSEEGEEQEGGGSGGGDGLSQFLSGMQRCQQVLIY